jgi:hypothetical protein
MIGQIPIPLPGGGSSCSELSSTRAPAVISEVTQETSKSRTLLDRRKADGTEVEIPHPRNKASLFLILFMQAFPQLPSWEYSIPHQFPTTPGNAGETYRKRNLVGAAKISWFTFTEDVIQTLTGSVSSERGFHMGLRLTSFKSSKPW